MGSCAWYREWVTPEEIPPQNLKSYNQNHHLQDARCKEEDGFGLLSV